MILRLGRTTGTKLNTWALYERHHPARATASPLAVGHGYSEALTGIIGASRECTVSMISPLWMPCGWTEVMPWYSPPLRARSAGQCD